MCSTTRFCRTFSAGDHFGGIPVLDLMNLEFVTIVYFNTSITKTNDVQIKINIANAAFFPYAGRADVDIEADVGVVDPPCAGPPRITWE